MTELRWRPYLRNRLIADHPNGFVIITPDETNTCVPLSCDICVHVMKSRDDESAWHEFGCCHRCAMLWAHPRRQKWSEGWRPSPEQVAEAEENRLPLTVVLEID